MNKIPKMTREEWDDLHLDSSILDTDQYVDTAIMSMTWEFMEFLWKTLTHKQDKGNFNHLEFSRTTCEYILKREGLLTMYTDYTRDVYNMCANIGIKYKFKKPRNLKELVKEIKKMRLRISIEDWGKSGKSLMIYSAPTYSNHLNMVYSHNMWAQGYEEFKELSLFEQFISIIYKQGKRLGDNPKLVVDKYESSCMTPKELVFDKKDGRVSKVPAKKLTEYFNVSRRLHEDINGNTNLGLGFYGMENNKWYTYYADSHPYKDINIKTKKDVAKIVEDVEVGDCRYQYRLSMRVMILLRDHIAKNPSILYNAYKIADTTALKLYDLLGVKLLKYITTSDKVYEIIKGENNGKY